jgi:SAM-dependent methyltransferase
MGEPHAIASDVPELSDLVVDYEPETLARRPVRRDAVLAELARCRMRTAARIVERWPHEGGVLDAAFVDRVLVRAHLELQRLSEEFRQGERALVLLRPLLDALRARGVPPPYRVVDLGCGLGYVVRWLAAHGRLGGDVRLVGCDYNAVFVARAARLAEEERLEGCEFRVANAFRLEEPAHVFLSTGVIHHFRGEALDRFLEQQTTPTTQAFVHMDIKPTWLAPVGAWLFHQARMREPLARHDGVLSAMRAHPGDVLASSARKCCPELAVGVFDGAREALPVLKVMQARVGVRRDVAPAFVERLGSSRRRLEPFA